MLTIAIPTYNRADDLSVLLDEIVLQLDDVAPGFVEVVISDNASTDNTKDVAQHYKRVFAEKHSSVLYSCNRENLGFSPNVDLAVCNSHGEFVLIMGDDDGLEPGTLAHIRRVLDMHKNIDVLLLENVPYSDDLTERIGDNSGAISSMDDVTIFSDGVDYISFHRGYPPALVSGYLVRKSAWETANANDFTASISIHMLTVTRIMLKHGCVCESHRQSIKYRTGQTRATWSKDPLYPFRFYLDELSACRLFADETTRKIKRILYRVPVRTIAFYLIRQKIMRHPFNRREFWKSYGDAVSDRNVYTVLIACIRYAPRLLVWMIFHRIVQKNIIRNGI